jgi:hypothetical protein
MEVENGVKRKLRFGFGFWVGDDGVHSVEQWNSEDTGIGSIALQNSRFHCGLCLCVCVCVCFWFTAVTSRLTVFVYFLLPLPTTSFFRFFFCWCQYEFRYICTQLELDQYVQSSRNNSTSVMDSVSLSPPIAATLTGLTFFAPSGWRVGTLGGAIGLSAVGATYMTYSLIGKPYGSNGYLWF